MWLTANMKHWLNWFGGFLMFAPIPALLVYTISHPDMSKARILLCLGLTVVAFVLYLVGYALLVTHFIPNDDEHRDS